MKSKQLQRGSKFAYKFFIPILSISLLFGLSSCAATSKESATTTVTQSTTSSPSSVVETTEVTTQETTATEETTTTEETTSADSVSSRAVIPGILAADVKLNFKDFEFSGPKKVNDTAIDTGKFEQDGINYDIELFGNLPLEVEDTKFSIDNSALIGTADKSTMGSAVVAFLGYCSSLPYEGSTPEDAKAWVESAVKKVTIEKPIEKEFGGVYYALYGNYPSVLTLEMKPTSILGSNTNSGKSN